MRLLALIPARGGSKRLPGKSTLALGGKPLIVWSIDAAQRIPEVADCLVSTDDERIAQVAIEAGAMVPWLRPQHLATDQASSTDMALHALDWYESQFGRVDGLLLLQPTSPLRTLASVQKGIQLFRSHPQGAVVGMAQGQDGKHTHSGRRITGSFYLINPMTLRTRLSFSPADAIPLIQSHPGDLVDIDDWTDFEQAQSLLQRGESQAPNSRTNA